MKSKWGHHSLKVCLTETKKERSKESDLNSKTCPQTVTAKDEQKIVPWKTTDSRTAPFCKSWSFQLLLSALVLLVMLNFKQHAGIQHRAVAALVARPISERSAMQAHIEHRHPTDVSSCYFEKALFLSVAHQAFVLLWKSLKGQHFCGLLL